MMKDRKFENLYEEYQKDELFWEIEAKHDFAMALLEIIMDEGMTQAEFAQKLGKSSAYVSKLLSGNENPSIKTMVNCVRKLNRKLSIQLIKEDVKGNTISAHIDIKDQTHPYIKFKDNSILKAANDQNFATKEKMLFSMV
ncbi:hypothetical protein CEQ07_05320 [Oligella urethralis]|mgnify:FL=1|uniref:helix-turn-helix domain-containing protein n=1 Tax=Oligella urethralis TaxID=90245 RepID=UPI000D00DACC|nr:helix-turn-helix domain-containing protein [Oligella urethralis]AVL70886.1 hypothetical protein CEQ07_05320 [Oligella urethralis]